MMAIRTSVDVLEWACGHKCGSACAKCFDEYADDHRRLHEVMDCGHNLTFAWGGADGYLFCFQFKLALLGSVLDPATAILRDGDYGSYLAPGMIALTALFSSTF